SLNKKEHKGCESPDPECDPYMNTISFEEKYNRMNEDYQRAPMSPYPPGGLSPGAMPMHNSPYMNHSLQGHMGQHSPAISSPGLLQPPPGPGSLSPRPNSTGHMVEMSQSPTPNGYHRVSPCSSPGMIPGDEYLGGSGDGMVGGGGGMGQGYSPQPSPHHWSQGSLTSGIPPGGNMHHLQGSGQNIGSASGNHVSPLLINTMNQRLNIKSEPLSPTRDSNTPNMGLRPPSQNPGQYSPGHMSPHLNASHSNCSSPTPGLQQHGGHPPHQQNPVQPPGGPPVTMTTHDQHQQHGGMNGGCGLPDYDSGGPMMKRARLEGWTT
ncbi:hypothetical protein MAR_022738, partial [Mya arenaria]